MLGRPPHPRPHNLIIVCGLRAAINAPHTFTAAGFTTSFLDLMHHILPYFRFSTSIFFIICHSGNSWTMLCPPNNLITTPCQTSNYFTFPKTWMDWSKSYIFRRRLHTCWIQVKFCWRSFSTLMIPWNSAAPFICQFVNWFDSLSKTTQAIQRRINQPGPICARSHSIGWTLQKKLLHPW